MSIEIFRATLIRAPYAQEPQQVGFLPPQVESETDFAAYRAFAKTDWPPILMNFAQKHRFMDELLTSIRRHLGGEFDLLLMTCRVPGVMRFPAAFNAEDVFKIAEIEPEASRLAAQGLRLLTLREGFVRHPMEQGANELELTLRGGSESGRRGFAALGAEILASGLWRAEAPEPVSA